MVFAVNLHTRMDMSGFKKLYKQLEEATKTVAISGVINGDADAVKTAKLNEYGGTGIYERGPYAGQTVEVPARPFVRSAIEHHADEIIKVAKKNLDLDKDPNLIGALNAVGKKTAELQKKTLDSNGEGVPGWQKHNSPRTIETKNGLDKPLFTEFGETFPIDYELIRKAS